MESIFFYCSLCLHLFNLGFQDPNLLLQRNETCNPCLKYSLNSPEINIYYGLEYSDGDDVSFNHRLLPLFHKAIEEKIQYAYEKTEPEDFNLHFLTASGVNPYCDDILYKKLFNLLRNVHLFEREVHHIFEQQKETILYRTAQKVDNVAVVYQIIDYIVPLPKSYLLIDFYSEKTEENMKKLIGMEVYRAQQEAKNSAERLVVNETINNVKKFSKLISGAYVEYIECRKNIWSLNRFDKSLRALEEEFAQREMPKEHPGFEGILLRFDLTLEELSKVINEDFSITKLEGLKERVEQRLETFNSDL